MDEESVNLYRYYNKPHDLYEFEKVTTAKFFEWYDGFDEDEYDGIYVEIANSPRLAFMYVKYIIGRPVPELESVIAQEAKFAYQYAQAILKAPFPEGEPVIAQSGNYSYYYATFILEAPFPAGEENLKNPKEKVWRNHYYRKYPDRQYKDLR